MPSLKALKTRINSVKSTRKITSAMKMVAASKLKRAQDQAEAARPYSSRMQAMLRSVAGRMDNFQNAPKLLAGTGEDQRYLIVVCSSDRGLCGAFNTQLVREARRLAYDLIRSGKEISFLPVGKKARDNLRRDYKENIITYFTDIGKPRPKFEDADRIAAKVLELYDNGAFDKCFILYNKFQSALVQTVTLQQIVPVPIESPRVENAPEQAGAPAAAASMTYEFEPSEEQILQSLLPRNLKVQIFASLLESAASEHGARMTAMDNATRNAGDLIKKLNLQYNRQRQAFITKEIIEIISGAEAV